MINFIFNIVSRGRSLCKFSASIFNYFAFNLQFSNFVATTTSATSKLIFKLLTLCLRINWPKALSYKFAKLYMRLKEERCKQASKQQSERLAGCIALVIKSLINKVLWITLWNISSLTLDTWITSHQTCKPNCIFNERNFCVTRLKN